MEAAKSLGEYGLQIQNVALRTGLSTKEVGQFGFAARLAGQDVTIFERMMRGLSEVVDDTSQKGAKARAALKDLGVNARESNGELKPTATLLTEIAEGLSHTTNALERDNKAKAIFTRIGVEVIPVLMGLNENFKRAKEIGVGLSDEDLKRWEGYHKTITEAEVLWERFVRKAKEPVAAVLTIALKDTSGKQYTFDELEKRHVRFGSYKPRTAEQDDAALRAAGFGSIIDQRQGWNLATGLDRLEVSDRAVFARQRGDAAVSAFYARQGLQEQLKLAEADLHGAAVPEKGKSSLADVQAYEAAEQKVESLKSRIKQLADTIRLVIAGIEAQTKLSNDVTAKYLSGGRQLFLQGNGGMPDWASQGGINDPLGVAMKGYQDSNLLQVYGQMFGAWAFNQTRPGVDQSTDWFDSMNKQRIAEMQQGLKFSRMSGGFDLRKAQSNGASPGTVYGMQLAQIEREAALEEEIAQRKNDQLAMDAALSDKQERRYQAAIDYEDKLLQYAEMQKQFFQNFSVGLFQSAMGGNLGGFLKGQGMGIADRVVGNAAGMAWGSFSKMIPHASGTLGTLLEGTPFGADPAKQATIDNTMATIENTFALRALASSPSGGGGSAGGYSSAASTFARLFSSKPSSGGAVDENGPDYMADDPYVANDSGGSSKFAKGAAITAAVVGGGFAAYNGFSRGGGKGALEGTSGVLAAASMIPGPQQPFVMAAAMVTGVVSALLGDPKIARRNELERDAASRSYTMPSGADYFMDSSGRYTDYDYRGKTRPMVVNNYSISAMDGVTFRDFLLTHPDALSEGVTSAVQTGNGDDMVTTFAQRIAG
jgi:hypothetical protein